MDDRLTGKRLNKYIADSGYCSRREADRLISEGRVLLNGRPGALGDRVQPGMAVTVYKNHHWNRNEAYYWGRVNSCAPDHTEYMGGKMDIVRALHGSSSRPSVRARAEHILRTQSESCMGGCPAHSTDCAP